MLWSSNSTNTITQGLSKTKIKTDFGSDAVRNWRRSYSVAPPKLFPDDPRHPQNIDMFSSIPRESLPNTENLSDVRARVEKLWER